MIFGKVGETSHFILNEYDNGRIKAGMVKFYLQKITKKPFKLIIVDSCFSSIIRNGTPMHPGLSVSHDSVFHSPNSGSEIELEGAQSSSSLSIHHQHHADRLQVSALIFDRNRKIYSFVNLFTAVDDRQLFPNPH